MTSLEEPQPASNSNTNTNTEPVSASAASAVSTLPRARKVVGFVRSEPGFMISVIIGVFLLLNGIIFGILALLSAKKDVNSPFEAPDQYENYDVIGTSLFCLWNWIFWSLILIFPSITTTNREKNLFFFYLNGCSVFLIKLSIFFQKNTRFELITSLILEIFAYLFFMAVFSALYALPEEFHEISPVISLKPWVPVYEEIEPTDPNEEPNPTDSV